MLNLNRALGSRASFPDRIKLLAESQTRLCEEFPVEHHIAAENPVVEEKEKGGG